MTAPGDILQGRYQINEKIRQGGMGTVFKAKDLRLNKTVAVKSSRFTDEKLRKQFELEAHLLAFLRHTSLPIVSDHFREGDDLFLVMDYIPGDDLGEVMLARKEAFSVAEVLRWADQLLDVLGFMHEQNPPIIHRDIKPQNLKIFGSHIMLLDFGLAKGSPSPEIKITTTGSIFGYTPQYASLEQRQGTGTDARSDLYSLGATLYHLLSARMPADAWTRAAAVINGEPDPLRPLHQDYPHIPVPVSETIHLALSLKREARPASAAEMRRRLREAEVANTIVSPEPAPAGADTVRIETRVDEEEKPAPAPPSGNDDSVVTVSPPEPEPEPVPAPPRPATLVNRSVRAPSKLDYGFYGGVALGSISTVIVVATLALQLGIFGGTMWLISLTLTGAAVATFYVTRSPAPVKPLDVLKVGGVAGVVSAVVQWLLLVLTYLSSALTIRMGSAEALLVLVCLLGLLGCVSPLSAILAVRLLRGEKLQNR